MRRALPFLALPAVVAALYFFLGVADYWNGTACFKTVGYPGSESDNLDPTYRVYWRTSGCRVTGTEFLTHTPNNIAVRIMVRVFGPMRGTYHGPYPTREETREVLRGSEVIVTARALGYARSPGGLTGDCAQLARQFPPTEREPAARCAIFERSTVVLGHRDYAVLVDRHTGHQYARYYIR